MKRIQLNKSLFDEQHEVWQTTLSLSEIHPMFVWRYDVYDFFNTSRSDDVYQAILLDVLTQPTDDFEKDILMEL